MKKLLLSALMIAVLFGCSNDDDTVTPIVVPQAECVCEMKVWQMGTGYTTGEPVRFLSYGTSHDDVIHVELDEANYQFYRERFNAQNLKWIGLQDL